MSPYENVHFERADLRSDLLDDTDAFVTEDHVGGLVVCVGAAQSRMGDLEEDLVGGEVMLVSLGFHDPPGLAAFVHGVVHHDGSVRQ